MMRLSEILRIDLPLVQAPMAGVQDSALAIAVSQSGALGSLPAAMLSSEALEAELRLMTSELGTRPYNVNFFCHTMPSVQASDDSPWRKALRPYYDEFAISDAELQPGPARKPFDEQSLAVLERFRPPVVSFHFGLPEAALLARIKAWGARVFSSATSVDEARWLQQHGADVIIAQGLEAGGHRGHFLSDDLTTQLGTFALLPQIIQAVRVPVIAAGGIADASGIRAALTLGAAGVQLGTTFLLCDEARTTDVHRRALQSEHARHTALTNVFSGRPARGIVNRVMRELGPLSTLAPPFPLAGDALLPIRRAAEARQSGDFSSLWSGQNATGCAAVPAAELIARLRLRDL